MSQLVFKFPFKMKYYEQDFYVSSNNFAAYKLIESWPNWPGKWLNIFGSTGSGKTHLSKILEKKIKRVKIIKSNKVNNETIIKLDKLDCLVIDDYKRNIDENLLYSILNQSKQVENFIVINSISTIKKNIFKLKDLQSRIDSFVNIGIELPTDDLLRVILTKAFSDKQIEISKKNVDYILNHIDRSYKKVNSFANSIDNLSLAKAKPINLQLIKKVLNKLN